VRVDDELLAGADALFLTAAHNETGLVPDGAALFAAAPASCLVCSDAAQSIGRLGPPRDRVDAVVCSAHKLGGVAGVGALLLRGEGAQLPVPWSGGGQEGGRRPGTEATALVAAFGAAAAVIERTRADHGALAPLRDKLEADLVAAWPGARVLAAGAARLPNTTAIVAGDVDGEALRMAIDRAGVCVGFGSACSALAPEPSPGLLSLGLTARQARATVRLSLAPGATSQQLEEALARLTAIRLFGSG
jgi:cysteine desulfurase